MISADAPSFDTPYDAVYSTQHANKDTETHFDGQGMVLGEGYADYLPTSASRSAAYLPTSGSRSAAYLPTYDLFGSYLRCLPPPPRISAAYLPRAGRTRG